MEKEAYYFPHFCNARHDRKIKRLRKELGVEGYGIYFMLLELLREQQDMRYPLCDVDLVADEFGTSEQKVNAVIKAYELFEIDIEEKFFSPKMLVYLEPYFKMKQQRIEASKKAVEARKALKQPTDNRPITETQPIGNQSKVKERKEKESKLNEEFKEKVLLLFSSRPLIVEAVNMWKTYKDGRKETYTTTMWLVSLNKQLEKFTESEIIDSMHIAISSNHQGYFPKKSTHGPVMPNKIEPKEGQVRFKWATDPTGIERTVDKDKASDYFEKQALGGYIAVIL